MFFVPDAEKFSDTEIMHCKELAKTMGYNFDEETIKIMLELLESGVSADELTDILKKVKKELQESQK